MKVKIPLRFVLKKRLIPSLFILCSVLIGKTVKAQPEQVEISTHDTTAILQLIDDGRQLIRNLPDSAVTVLSYALELSRGAKFGKGERNALLNLTQIHYQQRRYEKSILLAQALKEASDTSHNQDAVFYAHYYKALSNQRLNNYPQAFEAYTQALRYIQDTSSWTLGIYNNLGELMRINNQPDKALEYFNRAIYLNNKSGGTHEKQLINIYSNAARMYTKTGAFEKAGAYYDSATAIALRHNEKESLFHIKLGQADLFNNQGRPNHALVYIEEARRIQANADRDFYNKHQLDFYTGEAYMRIPRYDLAEKYYLRALETVDSHSLSDRMVLTHKLSNIYDHTGDFEKAYKFHLASHNLLEEFKNKEVQTQLNEAEIRYKTAEKDKAIALKNVQLLESKRLLSRKNFWMLSIAAGAVIFALVLLLIFFNYRKKRKIEAQEKEIDQLKAMMNGEEKERVRLSRELHDGVGSMLAAIKMNAGSVRSAYQQGIPVGEELDRMITMLQETSSEVRTTAHNLMPDVLTRYDLQEAVIQYIQKINSSHDIRIDFHVPEPLRDLNKPAELLLYRMIQELIQNVLKHAEATHIEVQLLQLKEEINLMVEDNGKGMDTGSSGRGFKIAAADNEIAEPDGGNEAPPSDAGFGLDNLKYRVHALQGQLIVNSRPGKGTAVSISFDREKLKRVTA